MNDILQQVVTILPLCDLFLFLPVYRELQLDIKNKHIIIHPTMEFYLQQPNVKSYNRSPKIQNAWKSYENTIAFLYA